MGNDSSMTVILVLIAIAILLQACAMVGIWLAIRKIPGQIEAARADVRQRLEPLTQSVTQILTDSREPVQKITTNLAEISRLLKERSDSVDGMVADLVDKSRLQIIRVDQMVTTLVNKVETTADVVQQKVLAPIQEVSAVLKGVRSGLEFLFSRRQRTHVSEATPDEQLFI